MALTAAEKMKRYRERIKKDPEKYEKYRKKNIERLKQRRKKISQLDEKEKTIQIDQWAKQKRQQRFKNKKQKPTAQNSKLKYLKTKCAKLSSACKKKEERIKKLLTICEKLKKRNYRFKIDAEKQIQNRERIIEKMKAREQVLEDTMKRTYKACEKRSQKTILKRLITNSKVKSYVAKVIGLTGKVKKAKPKKASLVSEELVKFYVRDDVSRCTAGKKECRTYNKEKQQIRYLLNTLQNLYKKYKNEGGKYRFTTFYKYKPFYVLTPHLGSRNTCVCVKHNNIELKFASLKKHSVLENSNIKEILALQACDLKSFECMHGKCTKCKNIPIIYNETVQLNQNVTWYQWETIVHKYSKKEGSQSTEKTTKKTVKTEKNGTITQLLRDFENDIKPFKKHYFNNIHQQEKYQYIINNLKENEAVVICDFSENYETKLSEEIQSMHFGASKSQITLHTGMVYLQELSQSFCTVSQNNMHQPPAIWAHLLPILKMIKDDFQVMTIHFYTEGPTSQTKTIFYLIDLFIQKLELECVT
ncbi:unnamed protein product [Euphydryas editha]|uniref:Uncharacterized protein n=1 Tax=Euphydryas editha TaxID=104508 RepID=A0AAU9UAG9_EUPED|nr:unnamed protein product [Euphydryas editha]